eukprot:CAMPEP_0179467400 /NCGR_PEP_ID=MMETSP0799-20121207/48535_1 /TAXON_ID=46947 /ORGANISM="Geminigera cryophila, Strain CCMP2564" /LENGTH=295 /DNA_ID=CAMNT_0021272783 /DNA_START=130 /DNA_END=1013 /DNA_ORIENTATION=-
MAPSIAFCDKPRRVDGMMPPPHRAWSEVHHSVAASQRADVAGMMNERALTLASGLHARLGQDCPLLVLDGDMLRSLYDASEERANNLLDCGGPAPGCSLYGFMFDLQIGTALSEQSCLAVTALQIFASSSCEHYDLYTAQGTWRKKDDRHLPGSKHSSCESAKWRRIATLPQLRHTCNIDSGPQMHSLWLILPEPIYLTHGTTTALYLHSSDAWGAICYRDYECIRGLMSHFTGMLDDTGCQVQPGVETTANSYLRVLTGTFTQSPVPFQDVDGCVCAFAGRLEFDVVTIQLEGG